MTPIERTTLSNFTLPSSKDPKEIHETAMKCNDLIEKVNLLMFNTNDPGYPPSLYELSLCYRDGKGVKQDNFLFFSYLQRAAVGNYNVAQYDLCLCYLASGNRDLYSKLLLQLVERNYPPAQALYAKDLLNKPNRTKYEIRIAIYNLLHAAHEKYIPALLDLSVCYFLGIGVTQDEKKGIEKLEEAAKLEGEGGEAEERLLNYYKSNENSQLLQTETILLSIARAYLVGRVLEKNVEKGWDFLRKASEQGSLIAATDIKDRERSYQLLLQMENDPVALRELSNYYKYGIGNIAKDLKKSFDYLESAAKFGDHEAQLEVGISYWEGGEIKKNRAKAYNFLQMAKDKWDSRHQKICEEIESGFRTLKKSADQGDQEAAWQVANAYLKGEGCKKSRTRFSMYLERAADKGHSRALLHLGLLKAEISTRSYDFSQTLEYVAKVKSQDPAIAAEIITKIKEKWELLSIPKDSESNVKLNKLKWALKELLSFIDKK